MVEKGKWYDVVMELRNFAQYFWDVDVRTLDPKKHATYIIERIVEFGDERAASRLLENFSRNEILAVLKHSRRISPKSVLFWQLFAAAQ